MFWELPFNIVSFLNNFSMLRFVLVVLHGISRSVGHLCNLNCRVTGLKLTNKCSASFEGFKRCVFHLHCCCEEGIRKGILSEV